MYILIDGNIIIAGPGIDYSDPNQIDIGNNWPIIFEGISANKEDCYWDGKEVVLKSSITINKELTLKQLIETDKEMNRKLEDHVDLLINKNIVTISEYPEKFQEIYNLRKELRGNLNG